MVIKDTETGYGIVSRLFHWIMAIAIVALFVLGLWMVGLDYYSPYYNSAPDMHRSVGMVLLIALVARMLWRAINVKPKDDALSAFERTGARLLHAGFYPLLLVLMVSGYLISTSGGQGIDVFGLFTVPSLIKMKGLEDGAGFAHRWLAYVTIALAALHTAAALKHHFVDHGKTLTRMWSGPFE
jgi:cytochrome b561